MSFTNPAQRDWYSNNRETRFGGVPHNLHDLRRLEVGGSAWTCRCRATGTAPTADLAVAAYRRHAAQATPGRATDHTDIYATTEPTA